MTARASIFQPDEDEGLDVEGFAPTAAPRARDPFEMRAVRQTAEARGFVSREAVPAAAAVALPELAAPAIPQESRLRRRRTGRDRQINIKTTDDCIDRLYATADRHGWGLGETLERALSALEAQTGPEGPL